MCTSLKVYVVIVVSSTRVRITLIKQELKRYTYVNRDTDQKTVFKLRKNDGLKTCSVFVLVLKELFPP